MSAAGDGATQPLSGIAAIVVTYRPDMARLSRVLGGLPQNVAVVVVDNGSAPEIVDAIQVLLSNRGRARLLRNPSNVGLARAINQGAAAARQEFLLLLDQDSVPRQGSVAELLRALLELETGGLSVGCVGPVLIDDGTNLQHGFHCTRGWYWSRKFPPGDGRQPPLACANLNGSGTLVRAEVFDRVGGLEELLFIDHVDTEWSFRVTAAGMGLFGIPSAEFEHAMGERGLRFWWLGWRVWPQRPPERHYYLFRNAILLMRRGYVPAVWKAWAAVKLLGTMAVHAVVDPRRGQQLRRMMAGLRDGVRMKSGQDDAM